MKHILSTLAIALLGAVAIPVFAQDVPIPLDFEKYSVSFKEYENEYKQGEGLGGYYTIKMKGSGSLFITNFFNPALSNNLSGQSELLTNPIYGITHYGYIDSTTGETYEYRIDDTSRIEQFEGYSYDGWVADPNHPNGGAMGTTVVPRDGYFLGNFTDGQEIQVYLARKDADGKLLSWTSTAAGKSLEGVYASRWGGRTDAADNSMGVGQLYFPGLDEKQINFGVIASTTRPIGNTDVNPFSGSPLPGGLQIALVSGLFALGFWYLRRRKATVA